MSAFFDMFISCSVYIFYSIAYACEVCVHRIMPSLNTMNIDEIHHDKGLLCALLGVVDFF